MNQPHPPQTWKSPALNAAATSFLFAGLTWGASSVGWLLCCAISLVLAVAAVLLATLGGKLRPPAILGIVLSLLSCLVIFYSYRHASAGGRL